ncbi:MAG: hypothetical protein CM1200mP20_07980 [Pseudomonadota bacterium]|nr:MAG: hypothetical protein CM1200mP20_07980 [Pseudomonadota bacterium]
MEAIAAFRSDVVFRGALGDTFFDYLVALKGGGSRPFSFRGHRLGAKGVFRRILSLESARP